MIRQFAFTLIEVLVTIVVISISAVALTSVYTNMIAGSADPMIQQQATAIAEAYLEEISLRPFNNPGGGETGASEGEAGRALYNDVKDYRDLASGPAANQFGTPIAALGDYTVNVTITDAALGSIGPGNSLRIEVSVSHPAISPISVSGFRTNYF